MAKKFMKNFLLILVLILLPSLSSLSEAVPITFSDTLTSPGGTSYLHVLDNDDFTPALTDGQAFTINSAVLTINADITTGGSDSHFRDFEFAISLSVVRDNEDPILLLRRIFEIRRPNLVRKNEVLQFYLSGPALEKLGADREFQVDLVTGPLSGGSIKLNSSTLSGTGTAALIPEPGSMLLFGSGILGLFGIYRRRG